jgi:hypothetical protein
MSEPATTRRKFLKLLGITAGLSLTGTSTFAKNNNPEVLKLTSEQQEFMLLYELWMDEFIRVIHKI